MVGKSTASTEGKTTFSEEETERIILLWSEEEVLFNSRHNDYFKNYVRHNLINSSSNLNCTLIFFMRIYFIRILRLKFARKFQEYFKNKPEAEILVRI